MKRSHWLSAAAALLLVCGTAMAEFTVEDANGAIAVREDDAPVLVYNYDPVPPPEGVDEKFARSSYVHPLYGPDGEVYTQDYPDDHYHHRGVFWGWPQTRIGDRRMDIWAVDGARPHFERWLSLQGGSDSAVIGVQNNWRFDGDPWPKVREQVYMTIRPLEDGVRAIDFMLRFQNITNEVFTIVGQDTVDPKQQVMKGYGGFNIRPDKTRAPFTFHGSGGIIAEDALWEDTPWVSITWRDGEDGPAAGMALFQHSLNPDFPHGGWLLRHYGFLGQSWPHGEPVAIEPADYVELRYRILVFEGTAEEAGIADRFAAYSESPPRSP